MVGLPTAKADENYIRSLAKMGIGGIILFKHNYESLEQLIEVTNMVQTIFMKESYHELPAFIAVDQEGGRVQRFGPPFTSFPAQALQGSINSPKTSFEVGYVMGRELRAAGVNVNFSPVIDVLQFPESKAIGDRSFSAQAEIVASLGSALIRGLQKGGVLGVAKHFPGHGAVELDTHVDLPTCGKTQAQLDDLDWVPFKRVIRSKAEGIMTAHIVYPKIDADKPATLSRLWIQEILRKQLRHTKLIFTDDLEMGAILKKYTLQDASFLALSAGCDQLLLCHEQQQLETVWKYLVNAFQTGALPPTRLQEGLDRIETVKKRLILPYQQASLKDAQAIVGNADFQSVAQAIREGRTAENGPSTRI